jgi:hypothetical protein
MPGTGISGRHRLDAPSSQNEVPQRTLAPPTSEPTRVCSVSTERLTSQGLEALQQLLMDAHNERRDLEREISVASFEADLANQKYDRWRHGFLLKRICKKAFEKRRELGEINSAKRGELEEQLQLTTITTEITIDQRQEGPYLRMRDAFTALAKSKMLWNVLAEKRIDRLVERSSAGKAITRTPVKFSLGSCDLIHWREKAPHLANRAGGDLYIYPGFILYRAGRQAFALIESSNVVVRYSATRFHEDEWVPSDSKVVGHTWEKCNKDGTPDRRFDQNHQIPIAEYGSLEFTSKEGLLVRYLCSNSGAAEKFAIAWTAFQYSISNSDARIAVSSALAVSEALIESGGHFAKFKEAWTPVTDAWARAVPSGEAEGKTRFAIGKDVLVRYGQTLRDLLAAHSRIVAAVSKEFAEQAGIEISVLSAYNERILAVKRDLDAFMTALDHGQMTGDLLLSLMDRSSNYFRESQQVLENLSIAVERISYRQPV